MSQILCNIHFKNFSKSKNHYAIIQEHIENDTLKNLFIIVPTGKIVRFLKNQITEKYFEIHNKPIANLKLLTLKKFVEYCFHRLYSDKHFIIISDAYRTSLFEEAISNTDLQFFKSTNTTVNHAIIKKLCDVIYGLKEDGVEPEHLLADLNSIEDDSIINKNKIHDLYYSYLNYQNLLGSKYLDYPEILKKIHNKVILQNNSIDQIFSENEKIILFGFTEFKKPEIKFLSLFAKSNIPFGIYLDYCSENGPLFGNFEENIQTLQSNGFDIIPYSVSTNTSSETKDFIRKNLFNAKIKLQNKKLSQQIKIYEAKDRQSEVESIAKLVKYLNLKRNIEFKEICICHNYPQKYIKLFREVFHLYNIPVNVSERFPLQESPIVTTIFALLEIAVNKFLRTSLQKIAQNPYLTFKKGEETYIINFTNLFDVANKAKIYGSRLQLGKKYWLQRMEQLIELYDKKVKELLKDSDTDKFELLQTQNFLNSLTKAYEDFSVLSDSVNIPTTNISITKFNEIIKQNIIRNFSIIENIYNSYKELINSDKHLTDIEYLYKLEKIEKDSRALSTFISILDEFTFVLYDRFPNKLYSLNEIVTKLKTIIKSEKYQLHEKQSLGVTITTIEQTREIPYKVMILCGLVDKEFPALYIPESFLGKELPDAKSKFFHKERIKFYQFLTNGLENTEIKDKLFYIFYPKIENNEELIPSPFIDALLNILNPEDNNYIINISKYLNNPSEYISLPNFEQDYQWLNAICTEAHLINEKVKNTDIEKELPQVFIPNAELEKKLKYIHHILSKKGLNLTLEEINTRIAEKFNNKTYSSSEFETYVFCPFKYFLTYVLKIPEPKIFDLDLEPLEKGIFYHKILYRFYKTLQEEQKNNNPKFIITSINKNFPEIVPVELDISQKESYKSLLQNIAEEELQLISFDHPFFKLFKDLLFGTKKTKGYLEIYLENELNKIQNEWALKPVLFEFSFGTNVQNFVKIDDNLLLQGKIDRIELAQHNNKWYMLIADYKTNLNNLPTNKSILDGDSFQIPLYIYSAKKILKEIYNLETISIGGVYYSITPVQATDNSKNTFYSFILLSNESLLKEFVSSKLKSQVLNSGLNIEDIINETILNSKKIKEKILAGHFPIKPKKPKNCDMCKYKFVCRINEKL